MSLLRIDEIFNFEKGVLQSSKCVPGEFDFITASSDWKTHNEYTHECEALIFAAAASGSLGRTHYVNGKFISSDLCFIITPKDQENLPVDLKFYHILFNELKDEIVRNTKAGTSKEAIGLGSFGKYQLPYFDIDTQIEIKNQFVKSEELKSELSGELTSQVELVKKLRQQLLQDAVQGKLVEQNKKDEPAGELLKKIKAEKEKVIAEKNPSASLRARKEKELPPIKPEEIPFEIPENWVWCRLGEICEESFYGPRFGKGDYVPNGIPTIRTTDMTDDGAIILNDTPCINITDEKKIELYKVRNGDLLLTRSGSIGIMAIFRGDYLAIPSAYLIRFRFLNDILPEFVFSLLKSPQWQNLLGLNSRATAQVNINATNILKLPFPLPPLSEQTRIVQKLDELMQYCDALEASIKESEEQNGKLLQQVLREALRGKQEN